MKVVVLILALGVYTVTSVPASKLLPRFLEVPGDDELVTVDLDVKPDLELLNDLARNPRNQYLLFTRRNPTSGQTLVLDDANSILNSNFNPTHTTIAIAHGYTQSANSNINAVIRDAYLGAMEANVIVLDWSRIAQMDYYTAIYSIPSVGQGLGNLLGFISSVTGARLTNMHLAGFSLGSHVVGNAGRAMNGQFGRVTGLDPYSPIWTINSNRLARTDAIYVEAIHTSGNEGRHYFGDVDYFVNGGDSQPGCLTSICSHNRSWQVFAATVTYNHLMGRRCTSASEVTSNGCTGSLLPLGNADVNKRAHNRSWQLFAATVTYNHLMGRRCNNISEVTSNGCTGRLLPFGNVDVNKRATGMYRVNTGASYPY